MRVVPINEAEAIIEPYWDGNLFSLGDYEIIFSEAAAGCIEKTWFPVEGRIDKARPGETAVVMQRKCDISIEGYDIFKITASLPRGMCLTVKACIDGKVQTIINAVSGTESYEELEGLIAGRHMSEIRLEFSVTDTPPFLFDLMWIGLANSKALKRMKARKSPYTPDWPGLLGPKPVNFKPEIGIFFNCDELADIRKKIKEGPLKEEFDMLRQQAAEYMQFNPEEDIGRFVPFPHNTLYSRKCDFDKKLSAEAMPLLAFVGLIDENSDMSVMAARMALSAAHCEYWCSYFIAAFPGSTWHYRSFVEGVYCSACAIVLDWAGFCLTPGGRELIRDAIIMKGLPCIESDFKRHEYIRSMNQGIVFSFGRITGLLSLVPAYPRYKSIIDEAEKDLLEMLDNYVLNDGGVLEGMEYWAYSFNNAVPLLNILSRYHGMTLKEYVPQSIVNSGKYPLAMLSITGSGTACLPINDSGSSQAVSPYLAAVYCQISDRTEWKSLYASIMKSKEYAPDIYHIIFAPKEQEDDIPAVGPRFEVLMETGQVSSIRNDSGLGLIHFHLCSGPTDGGHYHGDKGSFILEAGDEALAIDRGVTSYDRPDANLIGFAVYHNLLYPESPDGVMIQQPHHAAGSKLTSAVDKNGVVMLCGNNKDAWEPGLFTANIRRVFSPTPDIYIIDDEIEMEKAHAMSFRINTTCTVMDVNGEMRIYGKKAFLRIVPINWAPEEDIVEADGVNWELKPVNLLKMLTKPCKSHRLLTAIQVAPVDTDPGQLWQFSSTSSTSSTIGVIASKGKYEIEYVPSGNQAVKAAVNPAVKVAVKADGNYILSADCFIDEWKINS